MASRRQPTWRAHQTRTYAACGHWSSFKWIGPTVNYNNSLRPLGRPTLGWHDAVTPTKKRRWFRKLWPLVRSPPRAEPYIYRRLCWCCFDIFRMNGCVRHKTKICAHARALAHSHRTYTHNTQTWGDLGLGCSKQTKPGEGGRAKVSTHPRHPDRIVFKGHGAKTHTHTHIARAAPCAHFHANEYPGFHTTHHTKLYTQGLVCSSFSSHVIYIAIWF